MDEAESLPLPDDFEIAIICAVPKEAEAVEKLFDKTWKSGEIGRHPGDRNTYTVGRVGNTFVVVVWLDGYGKTKAATAAAHLGFSFKRIEHALVVGICGGVPTPEGTSEIVLGDVVISTELQQYDSGKQYPFGYRTTGVAKPRKDMGAFVRKLSASGESRKALKNYSIDYLHRMLSRDEEYAARVRYPGVEEDVLFGPTHNHKHYPPAVCHTCTDMYSVCEEAREKSCHELHCSSYGSAQMRCRSQRRSLSTPENPTIHFGIVGSGDTVMKSAEHRDQIAKREKLIAFEMEGAGVHEEVFSIVVIKGVCDYADSHKNKSWQQYAATVAAACTGAFLKLKEEEYGFTPLQRRNTHTSITTIDSVMSHRSDSPINSGAHLPMGSVNGGNYGMPVDSLIRTLSSPPSPSSGFPSESFGPYRATRSTSETILDYGHLQGSGAKEEYTDWQTSRSQRPLYMIQHPRIMSEPILGGVAVPTQELEQEAPAPLHYQDKTSTSSTSGMDLPSVTQKVASNGLSKSAEETAQLLLETCSGTTDPIATEALLRDNTLNFNAKTTKGKSVAHSVLGTAKVVTNQSKMLRSANAIELLCRIGADIDAPDSTGLTPLHWCIKTANIAAARHLIKHGVHINAMDKDGRTPLYLLAMDGSPVLEMVDLLLHAGANLQGKRLPALSGRPKEIQHAVRARLRYIA